jgi:hypothetical protein
MISRETQSLVERYGGDVTSGEQVMVDMGDSVIVIRDGEVTATLGPGRHMLQQDGGLAFIVSSVERRWRAEGSPTFIDDATGQQVTLLVTIEYAVRVADAARFVTGIGDAELDGDTGIQEWVAAQLVELVATAVAEQPELDPAALGDTIVEQARGSLDGVGLEVTRVDDVSLEIQGE